MLVHMNDGDSTDAEARGDEGRATAAPFPFPGRRLKALLSSEVPCDYRTLCFSFFMGAVLSLPLGLALALTVRPFDPPTWVAPYYFGTAGGSLLILPLWSASALRKLPLLRRMGMVTFGWILAFLLLGSLLFPAL